MKEVFSQFHTEKQNSWYVTTIWTEFGSLRFIIICHVDHHKILTEIRNFSGLAESGF